MGGGWVSTTLLNLDSQIQVVHNGKINLIALFNQSGYVVWNTTYVHKIHDFDHVYFIDRSQDISMKEDFTSNDGWLE